MIDCQIVQPAMSEYINTLVSLYFLNDIGMFSQLIDSVMC